jgi:hypothetical protein
MNIPENEIGYDEAFELVGVLVFTEWVGNETLSSQEREQRMRRVRAAVNETFTDYEGAVHLDLWRDAALRKLVGQNL